MISVLEAMHYFQLVYLETFEICLWKYMNLTLLVLLLHQDKHGKQPQKRQKKTKVELDLLTNFDMLLMVEKGIREKNK